MEYEADLPVGNDLELQTSKSMLPPTGCPPWSRKRPSARRPRQSRNVNASDWLL